VHFMTYADIDARQDQVWAALADVENWPKWTASMRSVTRLDEGPFALGSRARVEQPRLPASVWEVTAMEAPTAFTWTTGRPGLAIEAVHRLLPRDGGVRVELTIIQTGALSWLTSALLGRLTRRYVEMEAQGLKRWCEGT
jgi:uncharacterized membrane protein